MYANHGSTARQQSAALRPAQEGSILVWALLFSIITSAMIVSHSTYMAAHRREMHVRYENVTLAENFARSGLVDALAWFQRQPNQPVQEFAPRLDPEGDPPLLDTLDPTVGLVREFEVRGNLWARYEARTDEAHDVSTQRGQSTPGTVWDVGARGYLYQLVDPDVPFDQAPNRIVASTYLRAEMQGIGVVPPASAAIAVSDPAAVDLGPQATIDAGDAPAIAYPADRAAPAIPAGTTVIGTPAVLGLVAFADAPEQVFSMPLDRLASLSDFVVDPGSARAPGGDDDDDDDGGDGGVGASHGGLAAPQGPVQGAGLRSEATAVSSSQGGRGRGHGRAHSRRELQRFLSFIRFFRRTFGNRGCGPDGDDAVVFGKGEADPELQVVRIPPAADKIEWVHGARRLHAAGRGQPEKAAAAEKIEDKVVLVRGDLKLDEHDALNGRGLVVVDGNLTVSSSNTSAFRGVLYVSGDADIEGDFRLDGALVVRGKLRIGHGSSPAVIRYSATNIGMVKKAVERYRLSRAVRPGWTGRP